MGGFGSGRHYRCGAKGCTDDMRRLDVRKMQREGLLTPGRSFGWNWIRNGEVVASINMKVSEGAVVLNYRARDHGGEWKDMAYPVRLDWTPVNYGGKRAWWLCPAVGCGRRVAVLFGGRIFACRHCHGLAFKSQRESPDDRATRKADKLRDRLGWEPGILNGEGGKPKGMHWRTYWRLRSEHDKAVMQALAGLGAMAEKMQERLGDIDERVRGLI